MSRAPPLSVLRLAPLLLPLIIVPSRAQIQAPDCLPAAFKVWNWTYNSLNQTPCSTAAYLAAECTNGRFTIPRLAQGNSYMGPVGNSADICKCNSVYYSVISACAGCQKCTWIPYDQWYANCTKVAPVSTFPQTITNDTLVPAWAFVNVSNTKPWDNVSACAFGGIPESKGNSRPPFAPQFDASTTKAVDIGLIVGVTLGSTILFLTIVGAGGWYLLRRRRRRRSSRANPRSSAQPLTAEQELSPVPWTPESDMKLYDPSDPSTYPNTSVLTQNAVSPAARNSTIIYLD